MPLGMATLIWLALVLGCNATSATDPVVPKQDASKAPAQVANAESSVVAELSEQNRASNVLEQIGSTAILFEDLAGRFALVRDQASARARPLPWAQAHRGCQRAFDDLVNQARVSEALAKAAISLDFVAIEQRLVQRRVGTTDFDKTLKLRGESKASLRAEFKREAGVEALLSAAGSLEISEAEIAAEYQRIRVSTDSDKPRAHVAHILVKFLPREEHATSSPENATVAQKRAWRKAARERAKELYRQARAPGADFAGLAARVSEDPSAAMGGDLGIVSPRDGMVAVFSDAVFALPAGAVSEPVQTRFGMHLIKVYERYEPGQLPMEAVRAQIHARLLLAKKRDASRELLAKLSQQYPATLASKHLEQICRGLAANDAG